MSSIANEGTTPSTRFDSGQMTGNRQPGSAEAQQPAQDDQVQGPHHAQAPQVKRALVEQGGDLLSSSNHSETFEQVFHAVIEANMNQSKEAS